MRPALRWGLAATLVLSALALGWPRAAPTVVQALPRAEGEVRAEIQPRSVAAGIEVAGLSSELVAWQIEPAKRDPFAPVLPPPPPTAKPPVPAVVPVVAAAPLPVIAPPPAAPPVSLRYLGAMVTPEGQRLVMLMRGDTALTVQEGTRLDEGYVVQAIGRDAVRLFYAPTSTVLDVPIPATPSESR
jgi:hypothetical protein